MKLKRLKTKDEFKRIEKQKLLSFKEDCVVVNCKKIVGGRRYTYEDGKCYDLKKYKQLREDYIRSNCDRISNEVERIITYSNKRFKRV